MNSTTAGRRGATPNPTRHRSMARFLLSNGLIALDPDTKPNAGGGGGTTNADRHALRGDEAVNHILAAEQRNPKRIARTLQKEIDRLRGIIDKGGTPEGAIVLTSDEDKALYQTAKATGKKAADLKKDLDSIPTLTSDNAANAMKLKNLEVAMNAVGYNPVALADFSNRMNIPLDMREVEQEDPKDKSKKVKVMVPHVVSHDKDGKEKVELLDTVLNRDYKIYVVALKAAPGKGNGSSTPPIGSVLEYPSGVPADSSGSPDASSDLLSLADNYLGSQYRFPGQETAEKK